MFFWLAVICCCFVCCQIPISAVVSFVEALEVGYSKHKNPYHNLMHAADVTQTVHYLLLKTGMVVSRINLSTEISWTYSWWFGSKQGILVDVIKEILSTWYSEHLFQLPNASLITALPDMQLLNMAFFFLWESMSHSFVKKKDKTSGEDHPLIPVSLRAGLRTSNHNSKNIWQNVTY